MLMLLSICLMYKDIFNYTSLISDNTVCQRCVFFCCNQAVRKCDNRSLRMELELAFDFIQIWEKGLIKNKEVIEQCRVYHTLAYWHMWEHNHIKTLVTKFWRITFSNVVSFKEFTSEKHIVFAKDFYIYLNLPIILQQKMFAAVICLSCRTCPQL